MIEFRIEQFLPCDLEAISGVIHRKPLPDPAAPLYFQHPLWAYPMNQGTLLDGDCGQFYSDHLSLLEKLPGKSALQLADNDQEFHELEQLYYYGAIGPQQVQGAQLNRITAGTEYASLYSPGETTWFTYIPQKIEIDLTWNCNFQCIHCAKDSSPASESGQMQLEDHIRLIEQAGQLGVPALTLMGGEPTCHPEFIELAVIARYAGIRTLATSTNGWLVDDALAAKMAHLFNSLQVSIHGSRAEVHDHIAGRTGAFERACRAIRLFREKGAKSVNIAFTVMKENLDELPAMVALAEELGAPSIRFLVLADEGRAHQLGLWTDEDKHRIAQQIGELHQSYQGKIEVEAGGFPAYCAIDPQAAVYGCPGGRTLMYVNADGEIRPCHAMEDTIDRLQNQSDILALWHSELMVQLRQKLACKCPYNEICAGGCLGNQRWRQVFLDTKGGINARCIA